MGSVWFSKKAFLYFGGAAIILIGGVIVLMAPYHFISYAIIENDQRTFSVLDQTGFYPQLEISVSMRLGNSTNVEIGCVLKENRTLDTIIVNISLNADNIVETNDATFLQGSTIVDVPYGNYTITVDQLIGIGRIDLGFKQVSDSRLWILIGGSMNILGLAMGIAGYFVAGSFLPTDSDIIVDWGYEDKNEDNQTNPGN